MKIGSVSKEGRKSLVAFDGDIVIDLTRAYESRLGGSGAADPRQQAEHELPSDLVQYLAKGEISRIATQRALEHADATRNRLPHYIYDLSAVNFTAIHRPPKIVATGNNYRDYREMLGIPASPVPLLILKSPSAVIGHGETIYLPKGYGVVYHEWELACVISRRCKNVARDGAGEVIFGYTILNDMTARAFEATSRELKPWGKNMDTFAPMGPWVVTPDEMPPDIYNLKTVRRRNGAVECESSTSNMDFGFAEIIEFITTFMTLEAGDVITTSTPPAGPVYPGDIIEAEIEGIGFLRNPVKGLSVDPGYARKAGLNLNAV